MKSQKLQTISDPVFKRIFGQEKSIVIELINGFIQGEAPVVDIDFLPSELLPNRSTEKTSIVDVLCIDSNNRHFVLEVQVIKQKSFKERVHYYASKLLVQSLEKSQQFADAIPVFIISFLNHIIEPDVEDWLHYYSHCNEKYPEKKINGIRLVFVELAKWKKLGKFDLENVRERWLSFLTSPEKIIAMPKHELEKYPNLEKAVLLLDEANYSKGQLLAHANYLNNLLAWNMTMIENYDDGFDSGMEKGIEKGMEKGIEKGKMQGMELMAELIQHLNEESLSMEEIASKFQVEIEQVLWVKKLLDK